ncbi:MAG: FecR family protein [Candidatus Gracilibacteria bacterium]|nr:FecR family protein [Candidatus Gracilibacteria bacterium]
MENSKRNIMILAGIGFMLIASIIAFVSFQTSNDNAYRYSVSTGSGEVEVSATGTVQNDVSSMLAYVSELSGNIKKTSANGAYFLKKSGEILAVGDTLKTGDDGTATVTFSDNSVIRLNNNSEISFQKLMKEDTQLELKNGEIWARVLKPLYDVSFFTINTGDLSTGVRGTSLSITTRKGKTQLEVIDSFAETDDKRGVTVRYKDPKTSQSIEEKIQPKKRLILNTGDTPTILKQDFKVDEIYADDFKRQSTQKDIILMDHLQKTFSGSKNLSDKVSGELAATLPKGTEIQKFFTEGAIRMQIASMTGTVKPEDIILGTKKEVYITSVRFETEQTLQLLQQEATPATQKVIEEKKSSIRKEMEETIDGVIKAQDIDPLLNLESNTILRDDGKESVYLSGTILIDLSDKQVRSGIETHIEKKKQEKNERLREILKPIPAETTQTGVSLPSPLPKTSTPGLPPPPVKPKVSLPVLLPRPSVSGELQTFPRPSVSGESIR